MAAGYTRAARGPTGEDEMILSNVLIALASAVTSAAGVALVRRWAISKSLLDIPNARSSHTNAIPRGGGIAIDFIVIVGLTALQGARWVGPWRSIAGYVAGMTIIASISFADDIRPVRASTRFFVQAGAALLLLLSIPETVATSGVPVVITAGAVLFWLVGLTNAYNFMDGIDGIAGLQAMIAGLAWTSVGIERREPLIGVVGALIGGSAAGFLLHNWSPARIFMGDVGSATLGFSFAALPLLGRRPDVTLFIGAAMFVWPFLFDTTITLFRRAIRGENIFAAHRSHLYQRLVIAGCSHRFVTLLYGVLAGIGAITGVHVVHDARSISVAAAAISIAAAALWIGVIFAERKAHRRAVAPSA